MNSRSTDVGDVTLKKKKNKSKNRIDTFDASGLVSRLTRQFQIMSFFIYCISFFNDSKKLNLFIVFVTFDRSARSYRQRKRKIQINCRKRSRKRIRNRTICMILIQIILSYLPRSGTIVILRRTSCP